MASKSRILSNLGNLLTSDNQVPTSGLTVSGVTAGTYGSSTAIPVITVDDRGRITVATTATVSGGGGGTLAISAGGTGATTAAGALTSLGAYPATNPNGYISSITSSNVTTALGFTPYNATNPSGYITSSGTAANVSGIVAVANGGTGTSTPGLVQGTNITITGTWPNQTINSTASGSGSVTSVGLSVPSFLSVTNSPITSSGTLDISYSGTPLPVLYGGTGTTTPGLVAGTNITITGTWPNQTITSTASGGGSGGSGGSGGGTYVTRTFTGNGSTTTYTVTSGVTVDSALVTQNGITQTPTTDYTITGTTLTFATAPATGELIQIRELASGGASGAGNAYAWFLI